MPLDDYLYHLGDVNSEVPFSFSSLVLVREKLPALKELIFPSKASDVWRLLDTSHNEVLAFTDPLIKGKNSMFFCWSSSDQEDLDQLRSSVQMRWGSHKQGLITSDSPTKNSRVIAVPGNWFVRR